MKKHPEQKEDEVFVTNTSTEDMPKIGWRTKRAGVTPYDIHGEALTIPDFFPVFVQKSEIIGHFGEQGAKELFQGQI